MRLLKLYPLFTFFFSFILFTPAVAQINAAIIDGKPGITNGEKLKQDNITDDWYSKATENIRLLQQQFFPTHANAFRVANAANRLGFVITQAGYSVQPIRQQQAAWQVDFTLKGIGRNGLQWAPGKVSSIVNHVNQLIYNYPQVSIEYINNKEGLRQNFIVKKKFAGEGSLTITIELESDMIAKLVAGNKLAFHTSANDEEIQLVYEDLKVWDANHQPLEASMKLAGRELIIEVDDSKAAYPVTIDPLNKTPEWSTSVDGVIASLSDVQLKAALYGFTVTALGDVNGDGYGDAAISAPALVDVFTGSGSLASVGAVFVYYGSSTGLSSTPNKTLQPNTAVAGALFGFSVAAGDVTGDGLNDIIVGAPLDRINLTIGILPVNGTVGKVYIYPGGSLANPNPSNFITIQLTTSQIGLLNISTNALFGFSVAVTEDMNGDNKKDILVGSPAYAGIPGALVKTGGAFLYLSGTNNTFPTIQNLEVPTFNILGINIPLVNSINGLLFGYSVDGTGDYNNDGKPDVVVGAPAGIDLSGLSGLLTGQVLGGQALVYYGTSNNTGVNTSIGARLQAASNGLLSNAANLFGFTVKGIKNANGTRNGNIVIGAPVGGLIPNALSLTIQTGNIHVFKKKTSSPSGVVISDQQLESPRSSNLLQVLNTLDLNVLFGTSVDNAYDVNCDGFSDLVVGEPLSSGTNLLQLQVNAAGGAAYVFFGDGTGGYVPAPKYEASATYGSGFLGVNATALFGFSVAGIPGIRGPGSAPRIMVGSPSGALDFDNSLLNLGNTLGLLFNFAVVDNGLGKSHLFHMNLCNSGGTLPVLITAFKGQLKNKAIELQWKTAQEINVHSYEVQRSSDGTNFKTVGLVFSWDNSMSNDYYFTDRTPAPGVNYYRLLIIDKDGTGKYSRTLTFRLDEETAGHVTVSPNPAIKNIRIMLTGHAKGNYRMELRNFAGHVQLSKSINITAAEQIEYLNRNLSILPGIYWLTVYDKNNQRISTNKVIVQ